MEQVLNAMVDAQGGCERIHKTPLPFVYASLIRQLLLIYLGSLPFVLVGRMGYAAPLVVAVVSFGMLGHRRGRRRNRATLWHRPQQPAARAESARRSPATQRPFAPARSANRVERGIDRRGLGKLQVTRARTAKRLKRTDQSFDHRAIKKRRTRKPRAASSK